MSVPRCLVDTSAWIETLRADGREEVRAEVAGLVREGDCVTCDMILLELWAGARSDAQRKALRELAEKSAWVETTPAVWVEARELARRARSRGLTVPAADLLIAACAGHYGLRILAVDTHFDRLARLSET